MERQGVAFYVREEWESTQLYHRIGDEPVKSLWVRIRDQHGRCCGGCPLQPTWSEEIGETFFRQLEETS